MFWFQRIMNLNTSSRNSVRSHSILYDTFSWHTQHNNTRMKNKKELRRETDREREKHIIIITSHFMAVNSSIHDNRNGNAYAQNQKSKWMVKRNSVCLRGRFFSTPSFSLSNLKWHAPNTRYIVNYIYQKISVQMPFEIVLGFSYFPSCFFSIDVDNKCSDFWFACLFVPCFRWWCCCCYFSKTEFHICVTIAINGNPIFYDF